ncbi:Hsp60 family chaperonin [Candidatus Similichlamydia epinepheli]|uniref:Hsp60 family chaperonin n=1 Tax=Candidatus Similichlamydia epinepheli TaxID=1903953 RepID=UPI0013007057|nr:molecular chaperone GroEL [Candidatus Similichlamydia epinepheli]
MSKNSKEILFSETARQKLADGIGKLAKAICHTLGPRGKNVALDKGWSSHSVTNNGNTILRSICLEDPFENLGAQLCREIANKLKTKCGGGSSTAVLLFHQMVVQSVRQINSGASPVLLKKGMEKAICYLTRAIEEASIPVSSHEDILALAKVSAHGAFSEEIGKIICDTIEKVGREGVVAIESGRSMETTVEIVEGMRLDRGYLSAYFITNPETRRVELKNPLILVSDQKVNSIQMILPILQSISVTRQELLIIADEFSSEVISTLVLNKLNGALKVAAMKAPGFGDQKKGLLEDICALTGAQFITEDLSRSLKDATTEMLGGASQVILTKDHTTIIEGKGSAADLTSRSSIVKKEADLAENDYDKKRLLQRAAKLQGGVAVVKVGASSETELDYKKQLFEDSLSSTQSGMSKGVVFGGGVALFHSSRGLSKTLKLDGDEALGAQIVEHASESLLKQLAENSGMNGDVVVSSILEHGKPTVGFNVITRSVEDFSKDQIVEPTEVAIESLTHAASATAMVIISEALIVEIPPAKGKKVAHPAHM